jgi:hypothetical protein
LELGQTFLLFPASKISTIWTAKVSHLVTSNGFPLACGSTAPFFELPFGELRRGLIIAGNRDGMLDNAN